MPRCLWKGLKASHEVIEDRPTLGTLGPQSVTDIEISGFDIIKLRVDQAAVYHSNDSTHMIDVQVLPSHVVTT